jgi:hypothetical protein
MFQLTDQEFQTATQVNAVKLGQTPPRQTTATAIVEAQQQSNTFFDGMIRDIEDKLIEPTLWKAWCCLMQFLDDAAAAPVVDAVGERAALALAQMSPAERFAAFAGSRFKVSGLSAVLARTRDFQKLLALMGAVQGNPVLLQAFLQRYSPQKLIARLFKSLNIDPETLEQDAQERAQQPQMLQQLQHMLQSQGGGGGGPTLPPLGEAEPTLPVERVPAPGEGVA